MNDWYFYQELGKTVGPLSALDVKTRIKDGRIRVFDLLYRDGEPAWKIALEHSALRSEFKTATLSSLKLKPWICLQRKAPDSTEFLTTGPFTQEEVRESVQAGKISYVDYAWKDGFAEWKRIGALEEFNPRMRSAALPHVPVPTSTEPAAELLKSVVEVKRAGAPVLQPPPPGVDPLDLTDSKIKTSWDIGQPEPSITAQIDKGNLLSEPLNATPPPLTTPPVVKGLTARQAIRPQSVTPAPQMQPPAAPPAAASTATGSFKVTKPSEEIDENKSKRMRRPLVDWSLVGALVLLLVGVVLIVSRFAISRTGSLPPEPAVETPAAAAANPRPTPEPAPAVEEPEPMAAAAEAASLESPSPAPTTEVAPPHAPTELFVAAQAQGSKPARIEVRTDGSAGFPVYIQIVGLPGQVTEGGGYYRFLRLSPPGDVHEPLDLSGVKLPLGKFVIRAETGNLKREIKLSQGAGDPTFKSTLNRQRKQWAHAIWKERLNAFHLSQLLEKQMTAALVPGKRLSLKGLEAITAVKRSSGASYLLFDDWWEMHEILHEAANGVNPSLAVRAQKERDRLAALTLWK